MSLCRLYWSCSREVEGRVRLDAISRKVGRWCGEAEQGMRVEEPGTLLVLLDAYEVTRDEGMLQRVLDVVGEGLALEIVDVWLETEFSGEARHQRRVDKVMALENK